MKKKCLVHRPTTYALFILILMCIVFHFSFADTASGNVLSDYEKNILFTDDGYYRFPPVLPGEIQKSLGQWELPQNELQLSEEKVMTTTMISGSIELLNGWNHISFPKTISNSSGHDQAGYVFAGVNTGAHTIYYYDSYSGLWESVTSSSVLKPLVGYAIYSVGPYTLYPDYVSAGQQSNPTTQLYYGWNLIGYFDPMGNSADDFFHAAMARDAMASLGTDWAELIGWNAAIQEYETSILRGADDSIYSEYRLVYPNKAYWLWMDTNRNLTYATSHTYTCSAEWVSEYPGGDADLPQSDDEAEGFYDTLSGAWSWSGSFIRGDNDNPPARAADWKDPSYYGGQDDNSSTGIDTTNFAFFSGHGWEGAGILFAYGYPDREEQNLWYNETIWGNTKVDWIALGSCHVLNQTDDNYAVWEDSFKGLHSIVGWDTFGVCHEDLGLVFAQYMTSQYPKTIWESWKEAGDYCIHSPGYSVGILAVDIDGNLNTKECIDDFIYAKGEMWYSPTGYNPNFDKDFHECDPD